MTFMDFLFYFFSFVMVASCAFVISARNQVYSILFLILAFLNAAGLLVLIGAEFMAMMFVIVYVGAVAVLFLFVVMMLEGQKGSFKTGLVRYYPAAALVGALLLIEISLFLFTPWKEGMSRYVFLPEDQSVLNVQAIGSVLYTDYFIVFQLVGLILLVAMIAAIVLTMHHYHGTKKQNVMHQLTRKADQSVSLEKITPKGERK